MKKEKQDINVIRHSLSHVMAMAVLDMFPEAKLGIGPAIDDGFYYDFDLPRALIPEDLPLIEQKMRSIIKSGIRFEGVEVRISEALDKLKQSDERYKCELVEGLKGEGRKKVTLYRAGGFVDLCEGPHVNSTAELRGVGFKLDKIAGAYWRGDEKNKMLQRIYGLAFTGKGALDKYLRDREEAIKRDHRVIGENLGLFTIRDEVGAGLPIWLPKGTVLRSLIMDYLRDELSRAGYEMIETPHIAKYELWKQSGHAEFYKENMYSSFKAEGQEFIVKPMNCPFHIYAYKNKLRSYRDLPVKLAEFGTVYRFEKSGVLHGLMRVRGFTQDDAHIFCREDQMNEEVAAAVKFALKVLRKFGFNDYEIYLSTKPEKAIGSDRVWEKATLALKKSLEKGGLKYQVDRGEGVFYGPKIDIKIKDSIGRAWQCTTVQVDFNLTEKFDVNYIGRDGKKTRAIMIHRALLGSLERFVGVLIEHYGGAFPVWLAPIQSIILPISDKHFTYAKEITQKLKMAGVRAELDGRAETIGKKIREAQLQKIPYMLIVGDKEIKLNKISVRELTKGDRGQVGTEAVIGEIKSRDSSKL